MPNIQWTPRPPRGWKRLKSVTTGLSIYSAVSCTFLERIVASLTLIALIAALAFEVYQCVVDISYIADISN